MGLSTWGHSLGGKEGKGAQKGFGGGGAGMSKKKFIDIKIGNRSLFPLAGGGRMKEIDKKEEDGNNPGP